MKEGALNDDDEIDKIKEAKETKEMEEKRRNIRRDKSITSVIVKYITTEIGE